MPDPKQRKPTPYRTRPIEEETAGKLYLVRDKDHGDGRPVLWGRDLPYPAASRLKEETAGRRLSKTVQVEEQTEANAHYRALPIDPRSSYRATGAPMAPVAYDPEDLATPVDPGIAAAQAAARAAVAPIAAAANARASAPPKVVIPPEALKPPAMPELPADIAEGEDPPIDPEELDALLNASDLPGAEDLAQAHADVPDDLTAPINVLELAQKFACTHVGDDGKPCGAGAGSPCTDPSGPITHHSRIQLATEAVARARA